MDENTIAAYREARSRWAYEHESAFRNEVADICSEFGIEAKVTDMDRVCAICVRGLSFGYPAEYRLTEILAPEEMREGFLAYASDIVKKYRKEFADSRKEEVTDESV